MNIAVCHRCGSSQSATTPLQAFCGNCGMARPAAGWPVRQVVYIDPHAVPATPLAPAHPNNRPPPSVAASHPKRNYTVPVVLCVCCLLVLFGTALSVMTFLTSLSYAQGRCTVTKNGTYYTSESTTDSHKHTVRKLITNLRISYTLQAADGRQYNDTSTGHHFDSLIASSDPSDEHPHNLDSMRAEYPVGSTHTCWYDANHPEGTH